MSDSTGDQDRIETELARTRARMDGRLSELQDRLSPGQILDDLMAYFRGSDGGDFVRNLMAGVKNNPMPVAVTGIGLAWLMASDPNARPRSPATDPIERDADRTSAAAVPPARWHSRAEFDRHIATYEGKIVRRPDESDQAFHTRIDEARGEALGVTREDQDTTESFSGRVREAFASARESLAETTENLGNLASGATGRVREAAGSAGDQISRGSQATQQMAANLLGNVAADPVILGALGLGIGAVLAALVPQSDQERAALNEVGRRAREGVSDLAKGAVDRGATATRQVMDAGRDSASEHGLADKSIGDLVDEALEGTLADSLGEVSTDVINAGDTAIREAAVGKAQVDDALRPAATSGVSADAPLTSTAPGTSDGVQSKPGAALPNVPSPSPGAKQTAPGPSSSGDSATGSTSPGSNSTKPE